MIIGVW